MILNVADILKESGSSRAFANELFLDNIVLHGETVEFKEPLHVEGRITNTGQLLIINASVHGIAVLECGSCMEKFEHKLDFTFEAKLTKSSTDDDPDLFIYQGHEIDLSEIVSEFILLELPIKRRCKEDCKGLCPDCGINLNLQSCQCENTEEKDPDKDVDERLRLLKDYFST